MSKPLRPYERAILRALSDGQPHGRDELLTAAALAVPDHEALSLFQRRNRGATDDFYGMPTGDQLLETQRQIAKGARAQADKSVSHLTDRGFIEAVDLERHGTRIVRTTFVLAEKGKVVLATGVVPHRSSIPNKVFTEEWQNRAKQLLADDPQMQPAEMYTNLQEAGYTGGPNPVAEWARKNRSEPPRVGRTKKPEPTVFTEKWQKRALAILAEHPQVRSYELFTILEREGYGGSRNPVDNFVRENRTQPASKATAPNMFLNELMGVIAGEGDAESKLCQIGTLVEAQKRYYDLRRQRR